MRIKLFVMKLKNSEMFWWFVQCMLLILLLLFIAVLLFDGVVYDIGKMMTDYFIEKYGETVCVVAAVFICGWMAVSYLYMKYGDKIVNDKRKATGE